MCPSVTHAHAHAHACAGPILSSSGSPQWLSCVISEETNVASALNTLAFSLVPNVPIARGSVIEIRGLAPATSPNGVGTPLEISGEDANIVADARLSCEFSLSVCLFICACLYASNARRLYTIYLHIFEFLCL